MSGDKTTEYCVQVAGDANWREIDEWGQSHYFFQAVKLKLEKMLVKKACGEISFDLWNISVVSWPGDNKVTLKTFWWNAGLLNLMGI